MKIRPLFDFSDRMVRSAMLVWLLLAFCNQTTSVQGAEALNARASQPNFVWLISEDNSKHWLNLYDKGGAATPRIAELAAQGLVFDHAFSNAPVCSVARTTLMTSCYAPRIGTQYHRRSVEVPMPEGLQMFPAYLRQAGYYTANNQKKDYNASEGEGVWDESSRKATWKNRGDQQPFFYMQSFSATHESSLHFPAADLETKPADHDPAAVQLAPYHPDTPLFRYTYARYLDRIQQVDSQIGQVVDQLAADGLLEDTFIFYFGDHGGVLPRGKGYTFESGLHIPLVVRVPGNWKHLVTQPVPSRVQGFVKFVDFGPTLLNLAGISMPRKIDGRPFLGPNIDARLMDLRDQAFGYADRFDEKYDLVRTFRKGQYKYVRSYQPLNIDGLQNNYRYQMAAYSEWRYLFHAGKLNAIQSQFFKARSAEALYDLQSDPHETRNLASSDEYRSILLDLRTRLSRQVCQIADLSFYPESVLVQEAFSDPTAFGKARSGDITNLVVVADAVLAFGDELRIAKIRGNLDASQFAAIKSLERFIQAEDPWQRYWCLIALSSIGTEYGWQYVEAFYPRARQLAADDSELLVRVRATEFLGLSGSIDPRDLLVSIINQSDNAIQTGLALNTVALFADTKPDWQFDVTDLQIPAQHKTFDVVKRRLEYLAER